VRTRKRRERIASCGEGGSSTPDLGAEFAGDRHRSVDGLEHHGGSSDPHGAS
jgi:hypothetical protein